MFQAVIYSLRAMAVCRILYPHHETNLINKINYKHTLKIKVSKYKSLDVKLSSNQNQDHLKSSLQRHTQTHCFRINQHPPNDIQKLELSDKYRNVECCAFVNALI